MECCSERVQEDNKDINCHSAQPTFTCSKSLMETPEQCEKSVQS